MAINWNYPAIFASGLLLGVAGTWLMPISPAPDKAAAIAPAQAPASAAKDAPVAQAAVAPPAALPSESCKVQPVLAAAGAKDAQYQVKADLSANKAQDMVTFVVLGKEAVAAGRPRDAEVAFLTACRLADQFKGESSAESADARYQLGRHYAQAALASPDSRRAELNRRSELLYSESLRTYLTLYGQSHEKTRFAAEGLERLKQQVAQVHHAAPAPAEAKKAAPVAPAPVAAASAPRKEVVVKAEPAPAREIVVKAEPAPRKIEVPKAEAAAPREKAEAAEPREQLPPRLRPSFDCSRARSTSEKLICSDAELARLDRELGRLHSRAREETADPEGFRRRNDQEWRRRESTCRDKECLLDWYAERREQLMDEQEQR